MRKVGQMSILIGKHLDQALAAIRCCCNFSIDWDVLDKIGRDAEDDRVNAKDYILHDSRQVQLAAHVEEYEPDTVILSIARGECAKFNGIVQDASESGFDKHEYWFAQPFDTPDLLTEALAAFHAQNPSSHPMAGSRLIAVSDLTAIVRCHHPVPSMRPTPYEILAIDLRAIHARELRGDEATPFAIQNYK